MQTLPEISELHGVAGLGLVLGVLPLLVLILLVRLLFGIDVIARSEAEIPGDVALSAPAQSHAAPATSVPRE